jgi:hypothetical protein
MTQRAASCTVDVDCYVYTFINRPTTKFIDFVRFFDQDPQTTGPNKAVSGKVGIKVKGEAVPILAQSGPLSCTKFVTENKTKGTKSTDIRLYYVDNNEIREAKFVDVKPDSDLNSGWVNPPDEQPDDKLSVVWVPNRAIDQTSYLTSGRTVPSKGKSDPPAPYVIFQDAGKPEVIKYARVTGSAGDPRWESSTLPVKLVPAKSS